MRKLVTLLTAIGLLLPMPAVLAQSSTLDTVTQTKVLRVCIWPDYFGISYRDPKTRQLTGIDVDMAKALGKDLGVAVQFVDSSFARLIDAAVTFFRTVG